MRTALALSCLDVLACAACGGPAPPLFQPVADIKRQDYMDAITNTNANRRVERDDLRNRSDS
jgi:hypothetical protein